MITELLMMATQDSDIQETFTPFFISYWIVQVLCKEYILLI